MKFKHSTLIAISGLVWLVIGFFLIRMGLHLAAGEMNGPVFYFLTNILGENQTAAVIIIAIGLAVGYVKGQYILSKSAQRTITRVKASPNPSGITKIFNLPYVLLIGCMMLLGFLVKGLSPDFRSFIDIAVGAALIRGAIFYFRAALSTRLVKNE